MQANSVFLEVDGLKYCLNFFLPLQYKIIQ